MATNPFFSGRIPKPLFEAIESYRQQTEESKTDVLTKALAKYINYELEENKPNIPPIQKTFDEIFYRLEAIEKELPNFIKKKKEQKVEQLEIKSDNIKITHSKSKLIENDNQKITTDNTKVLSTKEVTNLINLKQSTMSHWKRKNKLPKTINGYIIDFDHHQMNPKADFWKITKVDN